MKKIFFSPKRLISFLLLLFFGNICFSQDGWIDRTFNSFGSGFANSLGTNGSILACAIQSDGKIIIAGNFTSYNGTETNRIARLNPNGTIDNSFIIGAGFNGVVNDIKIQPDGKIIAAGNFTSYNGIEKSRLVRLNSTGGLEANFNLGSGANNEIKTIAFTSNAKIIIGGNFTTYNGLSKGRIAQLNFNGTIDENFDSQANGNIIKIAVQPNGKIILGGEFTFVSGISRKCIARLEANGNLDFEFDVENGASDAVLAIEVLSNNKIIIAGKFDQYNNETKNCVVRLNPSGQIDETFESPLNNSNSNKVSAVIELPNNKILIGGKFFVGNGKFKCLYKLNSDGSIDNNFFSPLLSLSDESVNLNTLKLQSDGKIILGGNFGSYFERVRNNLARLNTNGELEYAGGNNYINHIARQGNKTIIGGFFTAYNGADVNYIARINKKGKIDSSFHANLTFSVEAIAIQPNGKILISGGFSNDGMYRLNQNGSIDETFNQGTGPDNAIEKICVQPDGKIIIAGFFSNYNGVEKNCIARLNEDGSIDNTFTIGSGFATNSSFGRNISDLFVYPNGKILTVGEFTSYNGIDRNRIARLEENGDIDMGFNPGSGADFTITKVILQPNGKILIGGSFSSYNQINTNRLARLYPNGDIDNSFEIGTGPNRSVSAILFSGRKIFIGGAFTTFNNQNSGGLVRLLSNGSIDNSFETGTGVKGGDNVFGNIKVIIEEGIGRILIGGDFTSYNETETNRIARVFTSTTIPQNSIMHQADNVSSDGATDYSKIENSDYLDQNKKANLQEKSFLIYPNPSSNYVTIDTQASMEIEIVNTFGQSLIYQKIDCNNYRSKTIDTSNLKNGVYLIKTSEGIVKKFIKE
jgi:uncharacterized delta-60 repeat protein